MINQIIEKIWIEKNFKIDNQTKQNFKNAFKNKKIISIKNIGKYILFELNNNLTLVIHQKISGHLLLEKFFYRNKRWISKNQIINQDPNNRFIRFSVLLKNHFVMALSDPRKLSRVTLIESKKINDIVLIKKMGIGPLEKSFTIKKFLDKLLKHPNVPIKKALLDQSIVSGIGNIYSDEILFLSKIRPTRIVNKLTPNELSLLRKNIIKIIKKAIISQGTSFSNYRNPDGQKGNNLKNLKVYQKENLPCKKCHAPIIRIVINNRGCYFCNNCQK